MLQTVGISKLGNQAIAPKEKIQHVEMAEPRIARMQKNALESLLGVCL